METKEIWKGIERLDNHYEISSLGKIRSIGRVVDSSYQLKSGKYVSRITSIEGITLAAIVDRTGYLKCRINHKGKRYSLSIHREVAKAFCDGYGEGLVVDHIDEDKTNNNYLNLRWVTHGYNTKRRKEGKLYAKKAPAYSGKVLAYDKDTGELKHTLIGNRDMKEKGFDYRNVSAVLHGKRKSHRGCVFEKVDDTRKPVKEVESFTKNSFKPLDIIEVDGTIVDTIHSYEDLLNKGYIFQKVQRVLLGLEVSHRGYTFKIKQENTDDD